MNSILAVPGGGPEARNRDYKELKARIHQELLDRLNLERLNRVPREEAEPQIRDMIADMIGKETRTTPLNLVDASRPASGDRATNRPLNVPSHPLRQSPESGSFSGTSFCNRERTGASMR